MFQNLKVEGSVGGRKLSLETGKLALQADGAVLVTQGETQVLVTVVAGKEPKEGLDFFPLTVDVEERMYAAGKIPGGFFRREGRPSEEAILTARLIDRPLRPSFPKGFRNEVHVVATVLSADQKNPPDVPAMSGASAAILLAGLPFQGPVGAVRLGLRADGSWLVNPTFQELEECTFDMVVAGRDGSGGGVDILMVEAEAPEKALAVMKQGGPMPTERVVALGLEFARGPLLEAARLQSELALRAGAVQRDFPLFRDYTEELFQALEAEFGEAVREALAIPGKLEREEALEELKRKASEALAARFGQAWEEMAGGLAPAFRALERKIARKRILEEGLRIDGRKPNQIRPISVEVGLLPMAHGSALFTRGETQVLSAATLGMPRMQQIIDTIAPEESKRYMHHYNFPPFSTGEPGFMRGPRRREIGHGALAERALLPVIPPEEEFPYAIRVVSDVLSSNGSTSMASVCGSTLALMDAGVPIREPVGGVAMGLVAEEGKYVTLTDILGAEDAYGDMDFKVAGTKRYITALQLDTKVPGLPVEVLASALEEARRARLAILEVMLKTLPRPRPELSPRAPRIIVEVIPVDKIGEVIGPKGKKVNEIASLTGAEIDIEDDGTIYIGAKDEAAAQEALRMIREVVSPVEPKVGERYLGTVVKTTPFGAFVQLVRGRDGLIHISRLGKGERVKRVEDVVKVGDRILVEVVEIDKLNRISLKPVEDGE